MKFGTWNVRRLYTPYLLAEIEWYKMNIIATQEVSWPGCRDVMPGNYILFYGGYNTHDLDTGFIVENNMNTDLEGISNNMMR